ncbi:MAG: hypothetical protein WA892_09540 [Ornithinimicrobium sp.]
MTEPTDFTAAHNVHYPERVAPPDVVVDVAQAVQGIDGVLRLEPSVRDVLRLADPTRLLPSGRHREQQGVTVSIFGSITDVTVDVAVAARSQALATARVIHDRAVEVLHAHAREPGRITVNVLAIEYDTSAGSPDPASVAQAPAG